MNPQPGQLVDVGGYRMHIDCIGKGSPTVVLDSGLSDSSLSWYKAQPEVAQFTRVCSYDRAGLGWSEPSRAPRRCRSARPADPATRAAPPERMIFCSPMQNHPKG